VVAQIINKSLSFCRHQSQSITATSKTHHTSQP